MIVRILGEGQYDVSDDALPRLNLLDRAVESAVDDDDPEALAEALLALLDGVRTVGVPRGPGTLDESDLILPHPDATLDEIRGLLDEDGLIRG